MIKELTDKGYFKGKSGAKYQVKLDAITLKRAPYFERLVLELSHAMEFKAILKSIDTAANFLGSPMETNEIVNRNRSALEVLRNLQKGVNHFQENKIPTIVQFCALFCVTDGEQNEYTIELVKQKSEDWEKIPYHFFFQLSKYIMDNYSPELKARRAIFGKRDSEDSKEDTH